MGFIVGFGGKIVVFVGEGKKSHNSVDGGRCGVRCSVNGRVRRKLGSVVSGSLDPMWNMNVARMVYCCR
jgi:hypothetical protein